MKKTIENPFKKKIAIALIALLPFGSLLAEDTPDEAFGTIANDEKGDMLQKITEEIPEAKAALDDCRQNNNNGKPSLDECVWAGLDGGQQEKILELMNSYKTGNGNEVAEAEGEGASKYNYNLGNFKKNKSKSVKVLESYLQKRLEEALYGDAQSNNNGIKANTDHTNFYRIWQSQLGKNLITQLSGYCLYSNPESGLVPHLGASDPSQFGSFKRAHLAEYYKSQNLNNLKVVQGDNPVAFNGFNKCISHISNDCRSGGSGSSISIPDDQDPTKTKQLYRYQIPQGRQAADITNEVSQIVGSKTAAQLEASQNITNPCELNRYMTGVKKSLNEMEGLVGEMNQRVQNGGGFQGIANVVEREPVDTDKITNISSGDLMEAEAKDGTKYKDAVEEEATALTECANSGDPENCSEYLSNKEDNEKVEDEFILRGIALKKKLEKDLLKNDKVEMEQLKEFFTEKGMSDENFQKLVASETAKRPNDDPIKVIQSVIENYYDNERKALEASLNKRLQATQRPDPQSSGGAPASVTQTIQNIKSQIESSPEDLATVFHYSNVVSSFLEVNGDGGSTGRNTKALAAELENNFFDGNGGGRGVATGSNGGSGYSNDLGNLSQFQEDSGDDSQDPGGSVQLGSDQIDQIQYGIKAD